MESHRPLSRTKGGGGRHASKIEIYYDAIGFCGHGCLPPTHHDIFLRIYFDLDIALHVSSQI